MPLPAAEKVPRPVTAQPVGAGYRVITHGLQHTASRVRGEGKEQVSDNFLSTDSGCYRRMPTCKE
jgi:hypothetical protein